MNDPGINDKQFFDDCPSPVFIYDVPTLKILAVNKAAIIWYEYSEEEFLKITLKDIWHHEENANMRQIIDRISNIKYYDGGRWRHVKKSGEEFNVHTYSSTTTFRGKHARMLLAIDVSKNIEIEKTNRELQLVIEKQKQQYSNILSTLAEVVWQRRVDTNELIYINEACLPVFGYTPDEMVADENLFFNSIHPEDKEKFFASFREKLVKGYTSSDFRFLHRDGSIRYLTATAALHKGENGQADTINGSTVDITKQKLAEEALKDKAEETENILESITDAFFAADKNWHLTYVNRAAEKMYNIKREEVLHKNVWEVFPKVPQSEFYDTFQRAVKEQVVSTVEGISPSTGRWVLASAYPTKSGIAVYFKDISEQKKLMEHISNNIQNLNSLINNTTDLIWSVDINLNIISANQAFKEAVFKLNKIVIGPRDYALPKELGEELIKERTSQYTRVLKGETFMTIDERLIEGEIVVRETNFNPIKDDIGNVIGASCFSRNVTERNNQLKKIKEQNEKLKEIAWIQSHKVRGPLATILGLTQIFDYNDPSDPTNQKIINGIKEEALRLDEIIKEVVNKTYHMDTL